MKTSCLVGWCAIVALSFGFSADYVSADEGEQAPAVAEGAAVSPPMCRCEGELGPSVARINQMLAEPLKSTGLEFTDEPLENIVNFLQDEYSIPIQLDKRALEDAGLTSDEPVVINLHRISLKSALRLLLKTKQLTYVIQDEVLIITTPEEAEANLVTCVYDVRGIVAALPQGSKTKADKSAATKFDPLIDAIVSCVHCETWSENGGGEAEIRPLPPGLLVISQTQAVHEQVAELLSAIRETLRQPIAHAAGEEAEMMGGRGGYGYGGKGMEGGYGGGRGGEMGAEPMPADATPFD